MMFLLVAQKTQETSGEAGSRFRCSECGKDLGPSDTPEDSHGMCEDCVKEFLKDIPGGFERWKELMSGNE